MTCTIKLIHCNGMPVTEVKANAFLRRKVTKSMNMTVQPQTQIREKKKIYI